MNILSLYDGMACGMIAMLNADVKVDRYVAYEIDKYAIKTATHNFPQIEECGDVFQGDFKQYEGFDFLIGGSPCTYWSICQTKNRETVASGMGWELFQQYVRALHEAKPKYFIYENNKSMSKAIRASIDEAFGFEAVLINSALVSAQNRQRLYWVGRRNADGTYSKVNVEQPEDRGILLKDVLDYSTDPVCVSLRGRMYRGEPQHYEARGDGKTNTLTSVEKDNRVAEPILIGRMPREDGVVTDSKQYRVYSTDGKAVTQCGQGGGLGAKTGLYACSVRIYAEPIEWDAAGCPIKARSVADGKVYPVYRVSDGKITIKGKQYPIKLRDGYYIFRKLTVTECKRLQTVPEWYEFPVSDSRAYKQLGNGWTCDVITHLIQSALCKTKEEWRP